MLLGAAFAAPVVVVEASGLDVASVRGPIGLAVGYRSAVSPDAERTPRAIEGPVRRAAGETLRLGLDFLEHAEAILALATTLLVTAEVTVEGGRLQLHSEESVGVSHLLSFPLCLPKQVSLVGPLAVLDGLVEDDDGDEQERADDQR